MWNPERVKKSTSPVIPSAARNLLLFVFKEIKQMLRFAQHDSPIFSHVPVSIFRRRKQPSSKSARRVPRDPATPDTEHRLGAGRTARYSVRPARLDHWRRAGRGLRYQQVLGARPCPTRGCLIASPEKAPVRNPFCGFVCFSIDQRESSSCRLPGVQSAFGELKLPVLLNQKLPVCAVP